MTTLVRRALAEVCTVPLLLVVDKSMWFVVLGVMRSPCSFPGAQLPVEQALPSSRLPAVPDQELQPDLRSVCAGASGRRLRFSLPPRPLPPWWHCFPAPAPLPRRRGPGDDLDWSRWGAVARNGGGSRRSWCAPSEESP